MVEGVGSTTTEKNRSQCFVYKATDVEEHDDATMCKANAGSTDDDIITSDVIPTVRLLM